MNGLRDLPFEDLGFAKVDHHRSVRHCMPEVIFGQGKHPDQVEGIANALLAKSPNLLLTRATEEMAERVRKLDSSTEYFPASRCVRVWRDRTVQGKGTIAAVCAGTSDIPVLEEARVTAEVMGNTVDSIYDVGVAGIHRLLTAAPSFDGGSGSHRLRWNGGRITERRRRPCLLPGDCRPDQRRVWRKLRRLGRAARHAEQLFE